MEIIATAFLHVFYVLRLACRWLNINYSEIRRLQPQELETILEYVESLVQTVLLKKFVKSILVL
jgi:hypothetical protein